MAKRGTRGGTRGTKRRASGASSSRPARRARHESPGHNRDSDTESDTTAMQTPTNTLVTTSADEQVTARTKVTSTAPKEKPARKMKITDNGREEDVMDILGKSPPPDEEEWLSKGTLAALKDDPASVPHFAPLISGTTATEQQLIREDLINAGAKLIPKAEWRQNLIDNGIHSADQIAPDGDIRLDIWLEACIPARFLPADKRQWAKLSWLMDTPVQIKPHDKFKEANRVGDYPTMLLYEKAKPNQRITVAGVAKNTVVLDPPGSGGPFDALRSSNRARLIDFLNTHEFWNEEGWTEEALSRIPSTIIADVRPNALAKFPWDIINKWPVALQHTLPLDAPFWAAKDGLPIWEEARKAKEEADAAAEERAALAARVLLLAPEPSPEPQPRRGPRPVGRLTPIPDTIILHKKPRKQERPMHNPNAVREVVPDFWASGPVTPPGNDSDTTVDAPDGDRLMDISPLRDSSVRLALSPDLSSPPRSVEDRLPSSPTVVPAIQPAVISISSDETEVEAGGSNEEDHQAPDGVFLGDSFNSTDLPRRDDWLPMSTKHSESDDEEFLVQGTHPDYWLNKGFREMPLHDNIYDALEAILGPLSDEFKQEEHFVTRPSIRIPIPDQLKSLLVDDWENVTKSLLLVPLPSQAPANFIIDTYYNEEKTNRRLGSADADLLLELCCGLKLYFEKAVGKILLYRFERLQLAEAREPHHSSTFSH